MEVSPKYVHKMIEDNDKNKYTTLYHLLRKRHERGELAPEELIFTPENEENGSNVVDEDQLENQNQYDQEESIQNQAEERVPSRKVKRIAEEVPKLRNYSRNKSRERSTHSNQSKKKSQGSKKGYRGNNKRYRSSERYGTNSSANRSRYSREDELPTIKPNVTVNDITVEVKEKITINTTVDGRSHSPSNKTHYTKRNFYLSGRGYEVRNRASRITPKSNMGIKM